MTLFHAPSVQSPTAWAIQKGGYRYGVHPAETAAGLTRADLVFGFDPGDVRRYGADTSGVAASDTAFAHAALVGRYVFIPTARGEQYKLTQTWTIANKASFYIEGEGGAAETASASILWYGGAAPVIQFDGPNVGGQNRVYGLRAKGFMIDGFANGVTRATCGVAFGDLASVYNELIKFGNFENLNIVRCRIGTWFGRDNALSDDVSGLTLINCLIDSNVDHGVFVGTGNAAGINFIGCQITNNGGAPTNDAVNGATGKGTNIYMAAGELNLTGNTTAGSPTTADIYSGANSIRINGHWSDTIGPALVASGTTNASYINGLRHFAGSMTTGNTPLSIEWAGPQPLVLGGCSLFGNVQLDSGNSTHVVDLGTQFLNGPAGFTGAQITAQNGYIGLGKFDTVNEARVSFGRPTPSDGGGTKPFTIWFADQSSGFRRQDGTFGITEMLNAGSSSIEMLINAYYNGSFKSIAAGPVGRFYMQGGANPTVALYSDANAAGADAALTFPNTHFAALSNQPTGGAAVKVLQLGSNKLVWYNNIPTAGTWTQGDMILNTSAAVAAPAYWMCTVGGTPGTWRAGPNL